MKRLSRLFGAKKDPTGSICSERQFHQKLKIERSRAHRNGHEFSLVVFDLEELQLSQKNINRMVAIIQKRIRDIDQVGWYNKKRLGVILPYTSSGGAKEFSQNIMTDVQDFKKQSKYTLITYPPEKKSGKEKQDESMLRSL